MTGWVTVLGGCYRLDGFDFFTEILYNYGVLKFNLTKMTDLQNEPTQDVKDRLNEEGFVYGDSRTGPDAQPASVRVTPESESIIKRVEGRVEQLMKEDADLDENVAKEKALAEISKEIETKKRRFDTVDEWIKHNQPKMEETKVIDPGMFTPSVDTLLKDPGDYIELQMDPNDPTDAGVVFVDKNRHLKYLPYPNPARFVINELGFDRDETMSTTSLLNMHRSFRGKLVSLGFKSGLLDRNLGNDLTRVQQEARSILLRHYRSHREKDESARDEERVARFGY